MPSKKQRAAATIELFAGTWPPANPLDMQAMWATLILDYDELSGTGYLDEEAEDFGEGGGPVSDAWLDIHARLRELEPVTVEAATALYHCWRRDDAVFLGDDWDELKVERARKLAKFKLPRPW